MGNDQLVTAIGMFLCARRNSLLRHPTVTERNTLRYLRIFSEATDKMLPNPSNPINTDVIDIIRYHRETEGKQEEVPIELLRRYELRFTPRTVKKGECPIYCASYLL